MHQIFLFDEFCLALSSNFYLFFPHSLCCDCFTHNRTGTHKMHHKLQPNYAVLLPFFPELFSYIKLGIWGVLRPLMAQLSLGPRNDLVRTQIPTSSKSKRKKEERKTKTKTNEEQSIRNQSFPIHILQILCLDMQILSSSRDHC